MSNKKLIAEAVAGALEDIWGGCTFDGEQWIANSHEAMTIADAVLNVMPSLEPTPEQIEAAARALRDDHANRVDTWVVPEWEKLPHGFKIEYRDKARAALVAAAGAAPQEPVSARSSYISPSLPGRVRNLWKSDPSENSVRTVLNLAGDLIQELIDIRAAPVQVDEAKLADVIEEARDRSRKERDITKESLGQFTARLLLERRTEWLRGGEQ